MSTYDYDRLSVNQAELLAHELRWHHIPVQPTAKEALINCYSAARRTNVWIPINRILILELDRTKFPSTFICQSYLGGQLWLRKYGDALNAQSQRFKLPKMCFEVIQACSLDPLPCDSWGNPLPDDTEMVQPVDRPGS